MTSRRRLAALLSVAAASGLRAPDDAPGDAPGGAAAGSKPHIVTVIVDDLGWANVGWHNDRGAPEVRTPNADSLAAEGVVLDSHYGYKVCTPSRSSFLSGRFPVHVTESLRDPDAPNAGVPGAMLTFPAKLKAQGYKTHLVGKWDAGAATPAHLPANRGFDSSLFYFSHKNDMWSSGVRDSSGAGRRDAAAATRIARGRVADRPRTGRGDAAGADRNSAPPRPGGR